jgi:UDP-glucose 6-dehydrogenase
MNITVIGSSHDGLLSGACLAGSDNDVQRLNIFPRKIAKLQQGGNQA